MATRAVVPGDDTQKKMSKSQAAIKIASLLEEHMTKSGLSEEKKDQRVKQFSKRADEATARHAKR
jgi:hypothetical protein